MSAAVADFRPADFAEFKIKKSADSEDAPVINLVRNPDILREVVVRRAQAREGGQTCMGPQIIVGFAAETGSAEKTPLELGREKMQRKGADFLAVNTVGVNLGFGTDENTITLLSALTEEEPVLMGSKKDVSVRLLEYVSGFFGEDCALARGRPGGAHLQQIRSALHKVFHSAFMKAEHSTRREERAGSFRLNARRVGEWRLFFVMS